MNNVTSLADRRSIRAGAPAPADERRLCRSRPSFQWSKPIEGDATVSEAERSDHMPLVSPVGKRTAWLALLALFASPACVIAAGLYFLFRG